MDSSGLAAGVLSLLQTGLKYRHRNGTVANLNWLYFGMPEATMTMTVWVE